MGANPNQVERYYMRAAEIRQIAEGFLNQNDRLALLQYADEIECLALEFETKEDGVAPRSQASA